MELLNGQTLSAVLRQGPMPLPRVVRIVRQILAGLAEAHEGGIVHRDVKPDNVLVEPTRGGKDRA